MKRTIQLKRQCRRCKTCATNPGGLSTHAVPGFAPVNCRICPECDKIYVWAKGPDGFEYIWQEYYNYVQNKNLVIKQMAQKPKTKKRKPDNKVIGILKKRLTEIGKIRDSLASDLQDLELAHNDCVEACNSIEEAIDALSRLV